MDPDVGDGVSSTDTGNHLAESCVITLPCATSPPGDNGNETVDIKVIFNKKKYDVTFKLDGTIGSLKKHLETLTGVPAATQKVMFKGSTQDSQTLRDLKVTANAKFMVVGSTLNDLLTVSQPGAVQGGASFDSNLSLPKEQLCKQDLHKKVLDKYGKPDDVMGGIRGGKELLPPTSLYGMYNKLGLKLRITFKLDLDQLWLASKENTEKIPFTTIKNVVSEAIEGHEEYHIMGFQLGPNEVSRYWIYWVPAQYVEAIKDTILGHWEY